VSITRLQSGLPQSFPATITADDGHRNRRRSPHPGYARGRYLARPMHAVGSSQRMFRIT